MLFERKDKIKNKLIFMRQWKWKYGNGKVNMETEICKRTHGNGNMETEL